jgi:RNA-binding protein YhbY
MSQTRADTDTAVEDEAVATPQANANTFAQSLFLDHRYTRQEASLLWRDHEHLLTIGSSGVRDSHRNSTHDLTNGHNFVKIKVATDKLNATAIALEIVSDERLQKKIHIVEVRPKGFLVARNDPLAAKKTVPARDKSLDSQAPTSQKRSSSSKLTQNRDKKFAFPTRGFKKIKSGFSDTLTSGKGTAKMLRKTTVVNPPRSGRKPRPGR